MKRTPKETPSGNDDRLSVSGPEQICDPSSDPAYAHIDRIGMPADIVDFYHASGIRTLYPPQALAVRAGLLKGTNILAAIPTASGKTLLAELAALRSIRNGGKALYVVPLRALASEKYRSFRRFESLGISVGISTGDLDRKEEYLGAYDIIIATSEKVDSFLRNETSWLAHITVLVLDEVHLIDSGNRGPTLEVTIIKMRRLNPAMQIVALSATVGNARMLARWLDAALVQSEWRPTRLREGVFCGGTLFFEKEKPGAAPSPGIIVPDGDTSPDRPRRPSRPSSRKKQAQDASADPDDFEQINIVPVGKDKDPAVSLAADVIRDGGQCLIFESSRRNAASVAKKAASAVSAYLSPSDKEMLDRLSDDILDQSETDLSKSLALCIRSGAAFHHAGLSSFQREIVETGFLKGYLKVISSTPTLAAGLNLPARRVIIRSYKRYDANDGMTPIPVLEYKQMAGRAGRPHLDPYGEAVLLAGKFEEIPVLYEKYIHAAPESVISRIGAENMLRTHVLSVIVSGFANTRASILSFFKASFFAFQEGQTSTIALNVLIGRCLDFLTEKEMIHEKTADPETFENDPVQNERGAELVSGPVSGKSAFISADRLSGLSASSDASGSFVPAADESRFVATNVGALVSRLYIDPLSASLILDGLFAAEQNGRTLPPIGLLQLVCSTPDMNLLYMKRNDYETIDDFICLNHDSFLSVPDRKNAAAYEWFMSEVKTALMLYDWTREISENEIAERYDVGEGDIRALSETAEWICGSAARLAGLCGRLQKTALSDLELCLRYGAPVELLSLLKISGIGRVRARRLYDAGIRLRDDLMTADVALVARILGRRIAEKVFREIGRTPEPFPETGRVRPRRSRSGNAGSGESGFVRSFDNENEDGGRKYAVQKNFGDFF